MPEIRAVLFDLGETLIYFEGLPLSWEAHYEAALAEMALACGRELDADDRALGVERLREANTRRNPRTQERTFAQILAPLLAGWQLAPDEAAQAEEAFFARFQQRRALYADTLPALTTLRDAGLRLAVLTDVPYGQSRRLTERDLTAVAPHLDLWRTSTEIGWRKPDPRGLRALCDALEIAPDEALCVGNEEKDVRAAQAAGIRAGRIDRTGAGASFGEDFRLRDLRELIDHL